MSDPKEIRRIRLQNEYEELSELDSMSDIIKIFPLGSPLYEEYRIIFNIRTIVGPEPAYRDQTICTLQIPENYPLEAPTLSAESRPFPWHPNWFENGVWDCGYWDITRSLTDLLEGCARTLQFDPEITNIYNVSNTNAVSFWEANKDNPDVIPCDKQVLPYWNYCRASNETQKNHSNFFEKLRKSFY